MAQSLCCDCNGPDFRQTQQYSVNTVSTILEGELKMLVLDAGKTYAR